VLGVFGQHTAHQVTDSRWQALVACQGRVAASLQFSPYHCDIVTLVQRRMAQRKAQQQHPQRIDIVGDRSLAAAGGKTHRGIGRLK
jgi:hypothetical protein